MWDAHSCMGGRSRTRRARSISGSSLGDRFYLELQRIGRPDEEARIAAAVALALGHAVGCPWSRLKRCALSRRQQDFESHEARVCIQEGTLLADPSRPRRYTGQQYLRTPAEMAALFADIPEALTNTVEIARRCSLALRLGEMRLPAYPVPDGSSAERHLWTESEARSGPTGAPPRPRERALSQAAAF